MTDRLRQGSPTISDALRTLIGNGCSIDRDGSLITLFNLDHKPVVKIMRRQRLAVFQDEYHQTAGAIPELSPLIEALESKGFEVHMD